MQTQMTTTERTEPLSRPEFDAISLPPPDQAAIFLDIDGTLLEIADRPGDVLADADLLALIERLRRVSRDAVAFVSGRPVADIDRIFAPLVLPAAGVHGAEIRFPDGSRFATSPEILDDARPRLHRFAHAHPGLLIEDKGAAIALHFRHRPDLGPLVAAYMREFGSSDALSVVQGKCVVELKPSMLDKGTAVARLLESPPFRGRTPIFIGDDSTDEEAFRFVNSRGGVSVRVGAAEPTSARTHLATPARVRALLRSFAASSVRDLPE